MASVSLRLDDIVNDFLLVEVTKAGYSDVSSRKGNVTLTLTSWGASKTVLV